jgi:hypothetical protein
MKPPIERIDIAVRNVGIAAIQTIAPTPPAIALSRTPCLMVWAAEDVIKILAPNAADPSEDAACNPNSAVVPIHAIIPALFLSEGKMWPTAMARRYHGIARITPPTALTREDHKMLYESARMSCITVAPQTV